jgi:hypothetical protein
MGFALMHSHCLGCGRVFSYNPRHVPSIRVEGVREPICEDCVDQANPQRIANGLKPIEVHPDAYNPIDERELPWE